MYNSPHRSLLKEAGEILNLNTLSLALPSFQESFKLYNEKR